MFHWIKSLFVVCPDPTVMRAANRKMGEDAALAVAHRFRTIGTVDELMADLKKIGSPLYLTTIAVNDFLGQCALRLYRAKANVKKRPMVKSRVFKRAKQTNEPAQCGF